MEENIKILTQTFDGVEYTLCATETYNENFFDIFSRTDNINDIRVFKQINENGKIFYEEANVEDKIQVLAKLSSENN